MDSAVVIFIHKLVDDEIVSTIKEENCASSIVRSFVDASEANFDVKNYDDSKLCLILDASPDQNDSLTVEAWPEDGSLLVSANPTKLNFPTLVKCQNCETNFPTKYQYQRHQCEFNSDKVALKSSSEDGVKNDAHECPVCYKTFASKSKLERHQASHNANNETNICEFCGKHFVSENRLRIHKENHCKKAGGISKFYRSDVTVWKCKKCHEVFASVQNANHHVLQCQDHPDKENMKEFEDYLEEEQPYSNKAGQPESNYIEKISTEILLQCEFCNRTFSDKNLLLMHQRKHTTLKNYECINCDKVFDSYSLASSHWLEKCSEFCNVFYLPKLSFCEYCDRTFKSHEILYNHKIKKQHYTPKLHIAVNVDKREEGNDKPKSPKENKDIVNKLIQDVLKTLEVPLVSKETTFAAQFIKTEPESGNTSSASNPPNEEPEPNENGKPKKDLKRKWHKTKPRSKKHCAAIDEGFKYQCERCIKVFNCIVSLEAHRSGEHVATFCCEECGQTLGSAKALLIHCRAHKSSKPYVCETCGRCYSQTSHLWQHMRFHQGIKPFACPHEGCEARYTIRPDLKDHIRKVHTRERPFKCNVCNKCFLTGSVYYQHRLIHTNDRRYGCEICKKRFFRADALNNHKRIHTNERPYPCTVCGREFRQKGDRNKHVRTQHPDQFRKHNM